jgi:puromycin-sensitive aminopeptidase
VWEQWTNDSFGAAQRLDSLRSSHPVIVPIKHAEEVEQVFDAISYCKGSSVVNMVNGLIGPDKFREGLQKYMKQHAYGNTETKDLWAAWSSVSGVDVAHIMNAWTTRMGYPYLKVVAESWKPDALEITLEQNWFLADGSMPSAEESKGVWEIPLIFATSTTTSKQAVIMSQKQQTFTIPIQSTGNDWVRVNAGQKALVRVAATEEMTRRLKPAIQAKTLSPVDRAALLLDAYALAKANLAPIEAVVDVLRAFGNEDSSVVWLVCLVWLYVRKLIICFSLLLFSGLLFPEFWKLCTCSWKATAVKGSKPLWSSARGLS